MRFKQLLPWCNNLESNQQRAENYGPVTALSQGQVLEAVNQI